MTTVVYSCLAVPFEDDMSKVKPRLDTASRIRLMFPYRHTARIDLPGTAVLLKCKCFSRAAVDVKLIFTKAFGTEEEFEASVEEDLILPRNELTEVAGGLRLFSLQCQREVVDRSLVITQTNIYSLLTKSFMASGPDAVKWYVYASSRMVVGDWDEMPVSYPPLKPFMASYMKTVTPATPRRTDVRSSEGIFSTYANNFGGSRVFALVNYASEVVAAACASSRRIGAIYREYNAERTAITCNSVTYANLAFYKDLGERFGSILDILHSTQDTAEEDERRVAAYRTRIRTVSDRGAVEIRRYLRDTTSYEAYDPTSVHSRYRFDEGNTALPNGLTEPAGCGQMCKDMLGEDMFTESMCKQIRGTSVASLSSLCNSDRTSLMTGEPIKPVLEKVHNLPVNTAFVGVPNGRGGYKYSRLINHRKLSKLYVSASAMHAVAAHAENPTMASYHRYRTLMARECGKTALNELINPHMTVYILSIDVDDEELTASFYRPGTADGWVARQKVVDALEAAMGEFMEVIDQREVLGESRREFHCQVFESTPPDANVKKVGLRVIYRFKHLIFKNTKVLNNFIRAFKFFLVRRIPSVAYSIDVHMYASAAGMMRLPMTYKMASGKYVRQLVPLFTSVNRAFTPVFGLVHSPHHLLAPHEEVKVMTSMGNISNLIKTAEKEEFKLRVENRAKRKIKRRGDEEDGVVLDVDVTTRFFRSLLESGAVMAAIHEKGGGVREESLTDVQRRVSARSCGEEYLFAPPIHWCTVRSHRDPMGNPCKYFVKIGEDKSTYSLWMYCFACRVDVGILDGMVPPETFVPTPEGAISPVQQLGGGPGISY